MGFYLYIAGAMTLVGMGVESIIRTIRVEIDEYRYVMRTPDRHGGAARIRMVFWGRLAVNLIEPFFALGLGCLAFMPAVDTTYETLRFALPLVLLVWLQFRLLRYNIMPPLAFVAMVLFTIGQIFWPEDKAGGLISEIEELSLSEPSDDQA